VNGNTLYRGWLVGVPDTATLKEAHLSDSGTVIVTMEAQV